MTAIESLKKIVVIGPESTGKSTLCAQLAEQFDTLWCPEYARSYLSTNGKEYTFTDLLHIAAGQLTMEDVMAEEVLKRKSARGPAPDPKTVNIPLLFIDTDLYVMKVWSEYVFGKSHDFILENIARRKYDLYLLCNTDLPWEYDELREYPEEEPRTELYRIYKEIMMHQPTPWVDISGDYAARLEKAVAAVNNLIGKP
jgi:NadR type nicotinamide-nucleotide adenylyltransferase